MSYPQVDEGVLGRAGAVRGGLLAHVEPGSPAARAGLQAGMRVMSADGEPLRDLIDWLWLTSEDEVELSLAAEGGEAPEGGEGRGEARGEVSVLLQRNPGEAWGLAFAYPLFDGLRTCKNACIFCFMDMLPPGLRPALSARDDDYRLSFLSGNFVTLTNMSPSDVRRVIDYRLSPLHVSLHAVTPAVRRRLMGANHARGLAVLDELLAAGIEVHTQIVLMPGINDGAELAKTLAWCAERPGILSVGVVPYGFTQFARVQEGFDAKQAARVIEHCAAGDSKVQLADEFYLLAGLELPPAAAYGDYPQFEDGIGMLRSFIDEWEAASTPSSPSATPSPPVLVTGTAFAPLLRKLLAQSFPAVRVLAIANTFFGGKVDVAGLLTAHDLIEQLPAQLTAANKLVLLPSVMFNDEGLTLDDKTATDLSAALNRQVDVVPCTAQALFERLRACTLYSAGSF